MTEFDITSNVFGVGRRTVWKQVQESTENQIVLTQLSHENLKKIVPAVDPNFHRNERVVYYANVLLNVQNPAYHQHGLQIMVIKF